MVAAQVPRIEIRAGGGVRQWRVALHPPLFPLLSVMAKDSGVGQHHEYGAPCPPEATKVAERRVQLAPILTAAS